MPAEQPQAGAGDVPVLEYATARKLPRPWGKGFLALAGTVVFPGLGHLMAGYRRRALFWFGMLVCVSAVFYAALLWPRFLPGLLVILPVSGLLAVGSYVDAFLCGRRSTRPMLGRPAVRYVFGLVFIVASAIFNPFWLGSLGLAYYMREYYVEAFRITSIGMTPTLQPGDQMLAHKKVSWTRWDLVVFQHPEMSGKIVSRVVGLPGETVELVGGQVKIDGQFVQPPSGVGPYASLQFRGSHDRLLAAKPGTGCTGNPIKLGEGEYYLLSDNTQAALDSRLWEVPVPGHQRGVVTAREIIGKVTYIHWPPERWRSFN